MRLRAHRRNLVVWSSSVGPADRYAPRLTQRAGTRRIRRFTHLGALVTVIGLIHLARAVRPRWRPLLAGVAAVAPRSRTPEAVFPRENFAQRILDGGGAATHTKRAIPGSAGELDAVPSRETACHRGLRLG